MFLRLPSISDMAWDRYVITFSYGLWLAVAITGCALGVCLAITNFSNNSNQRLSLTDTAFYIPSCICQQGQKAIFMNSLSFFFIFSLVVLYFHFQFIGCILNFFSYSFLILHSCPNIPVILIKIWPIINFSIRLYLHYQVPQRLLLYTSNEISFLEAIKQT